MNKKHLSRIRITSIAILLFGAWVRLAYLQVHGLDADELFTLSMLQSPTGLLLNTFANTAIEVDPKLYYLLIKPWVFMSGTSELSARLPNILFDLTLGAALISVARIRFGARPAIFAGLLWSFNPLLVWVSGMVRMYSMLGLVAGLCWLFLLNALATNHRKWWIAFTFAGVTAAYVHVLGFFVVASAVVAVLVASVRWRRKAGLAASAVILIAYLPYLLNLWKEIATPRRLGSILPLDWLDFSLKFFAAIIANDLTLPTQINILISLLCVGLLAYSLRRGKRTEVALLLLMILIVAVGSGYLALRQSIFEGRYMAYIIPLVILAISLGINRLPSTFGKAGVLMAFGLVAVVGFSNQVSPFARDDFRSAVEYVEIHADPNDLILIVSDYGVGPFKYYYQGESDIASPWHTVPNKQQVRQVLNKISGYDTLWLVLYQTNIADPDSLVDGWLRSRYPIRGEAYPGGLTVRGYDLRPMTTSLPAEAAPLKIVFDQKAALRGYQIYEPTLIAHDDRLHPPSGWVHVTLYWEALQTGAAFQPSLQLEDNLGQVWGVSLSRPTDVLALHPTMSWQPGEIWRSDFDINLNPVTPPGQYRIILQVFDPGGNQPWPVAGEGSDSSTWWAVPEPVTIIP